MPCKCAGASDLRREAEVGPLQQQSELEAQLDPLRREQAESEWDHPAISRQTPVHFLL